MAGGQQNHTASGGGLLNGVGWVFTEQNSCGCTFIRVGSVDPYIPAIGDLRRCDPGFKRESLRSWNSA
jgi:hypothetical protein